MTTSQTNIDIPEKLLLPNSVNIRTLTEYLERPLSYDERCMFEDVKIEKRMNNMLKGLYEQCIKKGNLYIPELTDLDGNCLFASLVYHKIAASVSDLRQNLALIMYIYKDYKNFIPCTELTLQEMFTFMNEIEFVSCKRKINNEPVFVNFYKYTYNVMCQDLTNNSSWTRIPTQLVLTVLSYIYKLEIIILSNLNEYENRINAFDNVPTKPPTKKIYLGHLGESHYVPLDLLEEDEELIPILYDEATNELQTWMQKMEKVKIRNYLQQQQQLQQIQQMRQEQQESQINQQHYFLPIQSMEESTTSSSASNVIQDQSHNTNQDSNYQIFL